MRKFHTLRPGTPGFLFLPFAETFCRRFEKCDFPVRSPSCRPCSAWSLSVTPGDQDIPSVSGVYGPRKKPINGMPAKAGFGAVTSSRVAFPSSKRYLTGVRRSIRSSRCWRGFGTIAWMSSTPARSIWPGCATVPFSILCRYSGRRMSRRSTGGW